MCPADDDRTLSAASSVAPNLLLTKLICDVDFSCQDPYRTAEPQFVTILPASYFSKSGLAQGTTRSGYQRLRPTKSSQTQNWTTWYLHITDLSGKKLEMRAVRGNLV
ncbi:hypothetical protein Y032_0032g2536 [Ancylostoma ceylanicum]|nr:hypothetical protein Y032_0032g2536 [Ancylostoma ceylanicum]